MATTLQRNQRGKTELHRKKVQEAFRSVEEQLRHWDLLTNTLRDHLLGLINGRVQVEYLHHHDSGHADAEDARQEQGVLLARQPFSVLERTEVKLHFKEEERKERLQDLFTELCGIYAKLQSIRSALCHEQKEAQREDVEQERLFPTLTLTKITDLLQELNQMHSKELLSKKMILDDLFSPTSSSSSSSSSSSASSSSQQQRNLAMIYLASWKAEPFIDRQRRDLILDMLREELFFPLLSADNTNTIEQQPQQQTQKRTRKTKEELFFTMIQREEYP
ncbi:hypothetical protein QOT17_008854 [Balamuthia mandrillaris]